MKDLGKTLKGYRAIGLDTMCFIYHLEANSFFSPLTLIIFDFLAKKKVKAYTSAITLAEILATAGIQDDPGLVAKHRLSLVRAPSLSIQDVNLQVAEKAALFRVKYNLRLPDAIQVATASLNSVSLFITNDDRFRRIKEFKVLVLKDFLKR